MAGELFGRVGLGLGFGDLALFKGYAAFTLQWTLTINGVKYVRTHAVTDQELHYADTEKAMDSLAKTIYEALREDARKAGHHSKAR